jgi:hypothetical protein
MWVFTRRALIVAGLFIGWIVLSIATAMATAFITVGLGWEPFEPEFGGESADTAFALGLIGWGFAAVAILWLQVRRWFLKEDRTWFSELDGTSGGR